MTLETLGRRVSSAEVAAAAGAGLRVEQGEGGGDGGEGEGELLLPGLHSAQLRPAQLGSVRCAYGERRRCLDRGHRSLYS